MSIGGRMLHEGHLILTDINGKIVWEQYSVSGNFVRIDIPQVSNAIYFLTVTEQDVVFHTKILKQ